MVNCLGYQLWLGSRNLAKQYWLTDGFKLDLLLLLKPNKLCTYLDVFGKIFINIFQATFFLYMLYMLLC